MHPEPPTARGKNPDEDARLSEQLALDAVRARMLGQRPAPRKLGRYEVREEIGRGGMAEVYAAWDPVLRRRVALKVVSGAGVHRHRSRIIREAQSQASVSHPNVVEIYDVGARAHEVFIAMELLAGDTLKSWMQREPPRPWTEIVDMFLRAAAGLVAAHQRGLVHRDFKPANVLLTPQGVPKVADFGLAVQSQDTASVSNSGHQGQAQAVRLTATGTTMGTPFYMAPEQHRGARLDARADQFAFCVALHEALYGDAPYLGTTVQRLGLEKEQGPTTLPRPVGLPRRIEAALLRGLSPRPNDRWQTMADLVAALRPPRPIRRRTYVATGALATVLGLGGWELATATPPCEDPSASSWSPEQQSALATTYASQPRWPRVQQDIDGWVRRFRETHTQACELRTPGPRDKSIACLQRAHGRLSAVLDVLTAAPPGSAVPFESTRRLPQPEACLGTEAAVTSPEFAAIDRQVAQLSALTFAYQMPEARAVGLEALTAAQNAHLPALEAEILFELGLIEVTSERHKQAREYLERSYFLADSVGDQHTATNAAGKLVFLLAKGSEPREATQWTAYARAQLERKPNPEASALLLVSESMLQHSLGDYRTAEQTARRAWDEVEAQWGPDHVYAAMSIANVGYAQLSRGALDEGAASLQLAIRRYAAAGNAGRPEYADAVMNLGIAHYRKGAYRKALELFEQALAAREEQGTSGPVDFGRLHVNRAICLVELDRIPDALEALRNARGLLSTALGDEHPMLATVDMNEGLIYHRSGDLLRARGAYLRAWTRQTTVYGEAHPIVAQTEHNLGVALNASGEYEAAVEHLRHSRTVFSQSMGPAADLTNLSAIELGLALAEVGQAESGLALLDDALGALVTSNGEYSRWSVLTLTYRGHVLRLLGRLAESEAALLDARRRYEKLEDGDVELDTELTLERARTSRALGRHPEAESLLRLAHEAARNNPGASRLRSAIETELAELGVKL